MKTEDLGPVAAIFEADEPVAWIARELREPAHQLRRLTVELIISSGRTEDRQPLIFIEVFHSG